MTTKKQLREEIAALRSVGGQMSNACFNLGQCHESDSGPTVHVGILLNFTAEHMRNLQKQWDAIKRSEPKGGA